MFVFLAKACLSIVAVKRREETQAHVCAKKKKNWPRLQLSCRKRRHHAESSHVSRMWLANRLRSRRRNGGAKTVFVQGGINYQRPSNGDSVLFSSLSFGEENSALKLLLTSEPAGIFSSSLTASSHSNLPALVEQIWSLKRIWMRSLEVIQHLSILLFCCRNNHKYLVLKSSFEGPVKVDSGKILQIFPRPFSCLGGFLSP